ncbi:MAG: alternative ribosome rescue aminoacyl-tRNA hydrolase ArfB [Gemmataceae bacterium]
MISINHNTHIPEEEVSWTFVRASGPGGQNVNKVASKAQLRWAFEANNTLRPDVKSRLRQQQKNRLTTEGDMIFVSQKYRDQERNREDCIGKLKDAIQRALHVPKTRKKTKPTRASRERRITAKKQRGEKKAARKRPSWD